MYRGFRRTFKEYTETLTQGSHENISARQQIADPTQNPIYCSILLGMESPG